MKNRLLAAFAGVLLVTALAACASAGGQTPSGAGGQPIPTATAGTTADESMMKTDDAMATDPMQKGDGMAEDTMMKPDGAMSGHSTHMTDTMAGDSLQMEESSKSPAGGAMEEGDGMANLAMSKPESRYVAYTADARAKANQKGRAVLFFTASWCPTCRAADVEYRANLDKIPSDVTVLLVNYDTEGALKQKYNITYQHTFVQVDGNGKQVTRWSGGAVDELLANLR